MRYYYLAFSYFNVFFVVAVSVTFLIVVTKSLTRSRFQGRKYFEGMHGRAWQQWWVCPTSFLSVLTNSSGRPQAKSSLLSEILLGMSSKNHQEVCLLGNSSSSKLTVKNNHPNWQSQWLPWNDWLFLVFLFNFLSRNISTHISERQGTAILWTSKTTFIFMKDMVRIVTQ